MLIHISSGNGVDEVCRAIWHFYNFLQKNDYDFELIELKEATCKEGIKSLLLTSSDEVFLKMQGSICYRFKSPFRPQHKRKNWYFSVECYEENNKEVIDEEKIVFQSMKSPKKGGQHVNTTCSGVRAIYVPLGIEAISYDQRSQHQNKKIAKNRLLGKIAFLAVEEAKTVEQNRWKKGKKVERGGGWVFELT